MFYSIDCPIVFPSFQEISETETLIVTVNRTVAFIQCKHPGYHTQIKVKYQCDKQKNQWQLLYQKSKFHLSYD